MKSIKEELLRMGLSPSSYEQCLKDISDKVNRVDGFDLDWSEIATKYSLTISGDQLRKMGSGIFGSANVYNYFKNKYEGNVSSPSIEDKLQEIRKEKQKLSDERVALNKKLRETARFEENMKMLESMIRKNGETTLLPFHNPSRHSGYDLLICISDFHMGLDVENKFGSYNSSIAEQELELYFSEIMKIKNLYNAENVYVAIIGDLISGNIHLTTQLENRENVVQQIQVVSELISAFVYELSKEFNCVYVNSVSGNHSRIGKKDAVLRGERLDGLVSWYMQAKLSHLDNVEFVIEDNYDDTIGVFDIRGNEFILLHGDYDSFNESGLSRIAMMIGHFPYAMVFGHLHHCSYDDIANVKLIRSGSFSGTSDDYSVSKRLKGNASQMVCAVSEDGIESFHPVLLS